MGIQVSICVVVGRIIQHRGERQLTQEGFSVNGVVRGGHFSTGKALNVRSSGYRDAYSLRGTGSTQIGFPVNGVGKGGAFSRHPFQCRSGIRWFAVLDYRVSYTGFRTGDGVVRGGGFSSNTEATRASRKWLGTLPLSNSVVNIGFL